MLGKVVKGVNPSADLGALRTVANLVMDMGVGQAIGGNELQSFLLNTVTVQRFPETSVLVT